MTDSALAASRVAGADPLSIDDLLGGTSALDRRLPVSLFPDLAGDKCERAKLSLHELAARIEQTSASAKERLPLLKLATFGDRKSAKGALRHTDNIEAVHGIEGDHDAGTLSVADAHAKLSAAGIAGLIYTTPSHKSESPRWRVLVPLSRSVVANEREALTAALNGVLEGALAPESFTAAQAYFYGRTGSAEIETAISSGKELDLCTGTRSGALGRDGKPYTERMTNTETHSIDDSDFRREPEWPRIRSALAIIPAEDFDTDYDGWCRVGMALHHEARGSARGRTLFDEWSKGGLKYDARAVRAKWESFSRKSGGVAIGTLFDLAKRYGWEPSTREPPQPSTLQVLTPSDCENLPNRGYVVKGLIAPRDLVCIYGAPGAGKSLISPHIGYAIAQGRETFGMRVKPGPVLYVAAEDAHGMRGRVKALKRRYGDANDFKLVDGVTDLLSEDSGDLTALRALVDAWQPQLVVIDTLALAFPGLEENDAAAMGRVVAISRSLTEGGAAVALVHHDTKAGTPTPRGHSLLNGALDAALQLMPSDQGVTKGKLSKNRNGTMDRLIAFCIATESLGEDEDGDPINAPLVQEVNAASLPSKAERLKPSEQAVLNRLHTLLEEGGRVTESDFREACIDDRKVSASETRDSRRRVATRAIAELLRRDAIVIDGGFVSLPSDGFDLDWESE
ncbi:AAA family ATPase [Erythrobacter rubeus]|uniref:AAA family ATPase n=1 Tax=Erythrobacter rubeus TaxID=2760803 RepID=A0ABR8KS42_9SPHN|nr:AAA family ATPase [Erythrobacter rubeus]MBD2842242.1 AAA family ATPase [Erythrobacter rubeus]